jgi:hypothetical protein
MRFTLFAAPLAIALSAGAFFTAQPAAAQSVACDIAPAKLRTMAASADASVQQKAMRNIALGEALCEARNRADAAKKFNLAAKAMGTDLATVLASSESASAR